MRILTTALIAIVLACGSVPAFAAQTIKLGTLAPEGSVWYLALQDMAAAWEEISDGKIKVRIYPGGIAGDDADMVRKMRIGQLHASALTGQGLSQIVSDLGVFQTPMLLRSDAELDYVRDRVAPKLEARLAEKGFKVLYWSEVGWVYLYSKKPVVSPADLKPLKLWVWSGDAVWAESLKDSGYHPVPLPATDIHMGLQSGLIDAFTTAPVAALSFQWFGQAPHMTHLKWAPLTAAMVVSNDAWEKIPDELKPELIKAARKASDAAQIDIRSFEAGAISTMQTHGLNLHEVPPEIEADWQAEAEEGYKKIVGRSVPREIFEEVLALRNEFRAGLKEE